VKIAIFKSRFVVLHVIADRC